MLSQLQSRLAGLLVCTVRVNCFGLLVGTEAPVMTPLTAAVKACWTAGMHLNALFVCATATFSKYWLMYSCMTVNVLVKPFLVATDTSLTSCAYAIA